MLDGSNVRFSSDPGSCRRPDEDCAKAITKRGQDERCKSPQVLFAAVFFDSRFSSLQSINLQQASLGPHSQGVLDALYKCQESTAWSNWLRPQVHALQP